MPILTNSEILAECNLVYSRANSYSAILGSLFHTMLLNGCRTVEAINKTAWDFSSAPDWILTTAKFGDLRHIDESEIDSMHISLIQDSSTADRIYSPDELRKIFNKFTSYPLLNCRNKQIACHLFRHNKIKQLYDGGMSVPNITAYMGHNHETSTMNYILSQIYF